jgi:hypothetical protein
MWMTPQRLLSTFFKAPAVAMVTQPFGYDVWLPEVIVAYIIEVEHSTEHLQNLYGGRRQTELSPLFYDAAWGLCRRGIFRPGIKDARGPGAADGASAEGYSLTAVGRSWIEQGASAVFIADPDRISQMFDKLSPQVWYRVFTTSNRGRAMPHLRRLSRVLRYVRSRRRIDLAGCRYREKWRRENHAEGIPSCER